MTPRADNPPLWAAFRLALMTAACAALLYGPAPSSAAVPGDIDGSGGVDAVDVQFVILAALGNDIPFDADVDSSGFVTALDVQLVVNGSLGVAAAPNPSPVQYGYTVVQTFPHDSAAFTQGLLIVDGAMFESTGLYGQSTLREVRVSDGAVLRKVDLPDNVFGEGIAEINGRIAMLTWQNRLGYVYRIDDFGFAGNFSYTTEGWGITTVGDRLIMSDGTATLRWLDPVSYAVTGSFVVKDGDVSVTRLNELEYINGEIWANIWQTDRVARIDPGNGRVTGYVNFAGLLSPAERRNADVLNGIAFDEATGAIYVTGKRWPKLFEVTVAPK